MERLYQTYKDRAAFLLVYIREAHPDSVLFTVDDGKEVLKKITQTDDLEQRSGTAQQCMATLRLSLPVVIDNEDNHVNTQYAGWPDRFYIVGVDGKIAYKGEQGPKGFKPAEVEDWLKEHTPATAGRSQEK